MPPIIASQSSIRKYQIEIFKVVLADNTTEASYRKLFSNSMINLVTIVNISFTLQIKPLLGFRMLLDISLLNN